MEQLFLEDNLWHGGVFLDDEVFSKIIQPSFEWMPSRNPDKLYLPMKMRNDSACRVCVSVGEYVGKYGIVGIREGGSAQDYHVVRTDLPGYVVGIIREQTGFRTFEEYVELKVCDREEKGQQEYFPCSEKADDMIKIREVLMSSGIPGINRILFDGEKQRKCDVIILNAVMDDPSLMFDYLMIKERPGQLLYGLLIFLRMIEAEKIMVVAGKRQQNVIKELINAAYKYFASELRDRISFVFVPDIYPGGRDEMVLQNLTEWIQGRTWVILHVDQVMGAYDMVYDHRPWTRRRFLIGGCMPVNGCYELPIGMVLKDAVQLLRGIWLRTSGILIDGGLMAGYAVNPVNAVVHSDMRSLLILPRIEENEQACLRCSRCADICPVGIVPWVEQCEDKLSECLGCGSCSYICPSRRRLKEYVQRGGRPSTDVNQKNYIELPETDCQLPSVVVTGYSSPYIRRASSPFTCILSPFKL
ncbi:MAG: hypothetical protein ACI4BB_00455 [Coprococcus sp.]